MILFEDKYKFRGEIGAEPKLTTLEDGGTVLNLSVNVPVSSKEQGAAYHEPYLLQVSIFGALAKQAHGVVKKGYGVTGEGRMHASRYKGRKGDHRASLGVICDSLGWFVEATDKVNYIEVKKAEGVKPGDNGKGTDVSVRSFLDGNGAGVSPGGVAAAA